MNDRDRALGFLVGVEETCAGRTVELGCGAAVLHDALPQVWDTNFIRVDAGKGLSYEDFVATADDVMGGAGLAHRKVSVRDPSEEGVLTAALAKAGWDSRQLATMVRKPEVPPPIPDRPVAEVSGAELEAAADAVWREMHPEYSDEVVDQLLEWDRVRSAALHERCFASFEGGEVASYCRLFSNGGVAQLEDVNTLKRFRRRGHALATVGQATATAMADHDLVFLVSDAGPPQTLYSRLGFGGVGAIDEAVLPGG